MTISFSGLASGLDTASWIEALTSIRQLSVTSLKTKKSSISSEQAEISKIQSLFSNVQIALDRLTDSKFGGSTDLFVQKGVDTNGAEAYTATVTSDADCKSYNIYVQQLATATVATSKYTVSKHISSQTTLADLGINDRGSLTFGVGDTTKTIEVRNNMSIEDFNTFLNSQGINVTFGVDDDGYITLKANNPQDNLVVTFAVDTSNFSSKLNFTRVQDEPGGPHYFKSVNSFFAMGLDTQIAQPTTNDIYTDGHTVSTGTLTINHKEIEIKSTTTLSDIINAINNDQEKSMATAVWDDAAGKLKLTATTEGYSHIIISDDCGFATAFGLKGTDAQVAGQNAIINIDGGENIYLSGMSTTATSTEVISPEKTVDKAGTFTSSTTYDLSELFRTTGSGSFSDGTTLLKNLRVLDNGSFEINGKTVSYEKDTDTIDSLVAKMNVAGAQAAEGKEFTAAYDATTNRITVTAKNEGSDMISFNSTIGDDTSSLLGVFGFTTQIYTLESQILSGAKTGIEHGMVVELTSAERINGSSSTYYKDAISKELSGSVTAALSSFKDSNNNSLGLTGDYELKINGNIVSFNAGESMNSLLGKICQLSNISAKYVDNELIITSDKAGVNLTVEDNLGDFAYKMGYLNATTVNTTEINPEKYDPYTFSIAAEVSQQETNTFDTRTSLNLSNIVSNLTSATKMWQLGITDSVFKVNGGNDVEIDHEMTITEVCNAIEDQNSNMRAIFTGSGIMLRTEVEGGTTPIGITATTGNFTTVMGWTDTYSTINGYVSPSTELPSTFIKIENSNIPVIIGGANVTEATNALRSALNHGDTTIGLDNEFALQALSNVVNGIGGSAIDCSGVNFILTRDIDMTDVNGFNAIGTSTNKFTGSFKGNGYTISNLRVFGNSGVGLFGYTDGARIIDTRLINTDVSATNAHAGGLVGHADQTGIENCYVEGKVSSTSSAGGLVGTADNCSISDVTAVAEVSANSTVGGLIGNATNGSTISYCKSSGTVTGGSGAGGLFGSFASSSVTNSQSYSFVTGTNNVGGFIGVVSGSNSYNNNTYIDKSSGKIAGSGTEPNSGVSYSANPYGSVALNTNLSDIGVTNSGVISINGVNTQTISATGTVNDIKNAINSISGTTKVTADLVNGELVLTSSTLNQPIIVADYSGNIASKIGILAPNATNGVNYQVNNYGQSTVQEQDWKVKENTLICGNPTAFTQNISTGNFYINEHEFTLTDSTKVSDLINAINNAHVGVTAAYEDGTITIQSTNHTNFSMRKGDSNFTEVYELTHAVQTTNYSVNYDAYTQANSFDVWAPMAQTRNLFNSDDMVTTGNFFVNGVEFTINENTTLQGIVNEINNNDRAFAIAEIVVDPDDMNDIRLKITSRLESRPEVSVSRGESNFTDVLKLTEKVVAVHETEQVQDLGSKTEYLGRAGLDTVLVGSKQFKDVDGKKFQEGIFSINGVNFTITDSTTLGDVINDINSNDIVGVNAYWNSQTGKLTISSREEGDKEITFSDGASNFLTVMRVNEAKSQTLGTNGYYHFTGGKTFTSSTNTITSDITHIDGLTINLKQVSQKENNRLVADTLTISNDTTYLEASVLDFVNQYNELVTELDDVTSTTGLFHSDVGLKSLASQLKSTLLTSTAATGSSYRMLAQLGISTVAPGASLNANTNTLSLDLNKLHDAVTTNTNEVKKFMLGDNSDYSNGVMTRLSSLMFSTMASSGFFATRNAMYGNQLNRFDSLITSAQSRISNYRSSLETKFASMEKLITSLQNAYSKMYGTLGISGNGSITNFF